MRDACVAEYPEIQRDLQDQPESRGLLAFIHDYVLHVDIPDDQKRRVKS